MILVKKSVQTHKSFEYAIFTTTNFAKYVIYHIIISDSCITRVRTLSYKK